MVRTEITFHRPKTLKKERNPKYPHIRAPPRNKLDHYQILKYPLTAESAMKKIEDNNTLVFIAGIRATRRRFVENDDAVEDLNLLRKTEISKPLLCVDSLLSMDQRLKDAAQAGDIDALYALIREDALVLKRIDELPIVDTPLHIAASAGHVDFAMVIVNLKASFTRKQTQIDAQFWQAELLNWKNKQGDTLLHIAASSDQIQVVKMLIGKRNVVKDIKNLDGETAMHILRRHLTDRDIRDMQKSAPGFLSSLLKSVRFNQIQVGVKERSKITQLFLSLLVYLGRTNKETPRETRDALLLVDTLILTATYQATLSPLVVFGRVQHI
ncbi:hypothetical protein GH714_010086 [Hevea brasiliensis]|uniref:Large ribosomal subunit protein uL23 N-terminal domain-containing protein n=1 Tax=Hevea brasiliensis TaxID=3981 RepID=A0A6A6N3G8_HEVBR|nr:hypothetical protein GH714_010086 [Hevea brasiliensis]